MCLAWMGSEIVLERCREEVLPSVDGRQFTREDAHGSQTTRRNLFLRRKTTLCPSVGGVTNGLVTVRSHK